MPTHRSTDHHDADTRSSSVHPVRRAAQIVSIAFLVIGVLGFVPGVTQNHDQLELAGHGSEAMLLGVFQVSILHNIVHLLFGVVGLAMSRTVRSARTYLIGGGVVYLVLWVYGLLIDKDHQANFVPVNSADDWLHFVLGAVMIALGVLLTRSHRAADRVG